MDFTIPFPKNEIERLRALLSYELLDTLPEKELDSITELASFICQTPISLITLLDKERQWFKSKVGFELPEISRNLSFCQQTILEGDFYQVPDLTEEPLFKKHPFVTGNGGDISFYAGYPLKTSDGYSIGTICVLDRVPRNLSDDQKKALETLAKAVIVQFELHKKNKTLQQEINILAEEKIKQKEIDLQAYRYALDETSIVFITDPKGVILYANEKQCAISKYSHKELIGKDARILNSGYHSKDFIRQMWQTIESGNTWKGEFRNIAKDGTYYWVDTTIIPFRDNNNKTYQYVAIRQDITDRKLREEKLTVYEDIVKYMTAGVYVFSLDNTEGPPEFTLTASNLAAFKMTGINGNKMIGRKMSALFPNLMGTDMPAKLKKIALGGKAMFVGEFQYSNQPVKQLYFELNAFSLPNNSICVSFDDITERKNVELELIKAKAVAEQSVIAKDNFLANMSHEIRTPMNAIIGFTDILSKSNLNAIQQESIQAVKSAGESLLEIINDILDISKIESGKLNIENRPFDIRETLTNVMDLLKIKANEKNIDLNFSLDANLPEIISGDKVRLNQIIINLVGNAIKFTHAGNVSVNVKCKEDNGDKCTVLFSVKDTGIGIPTDMLDNVFERFMQASSSTTRKFGGTGLGLTIVKNLIELQSGKIYVNSEIGKGSEFTFFITYQKVNEKGESKDINKKSDLLSKKKIKILLFEDNPLNQKLAKMVLKGFGMEVDLAENGRIGVEILKNSTYDLILMDLQMPEMDGYQATIAIRNELKLDTPIMAMTAHSLIGEKEKCLTIGMNDYITKPFKQDELFSKIQALVVEEKTFEINKNKLPSQVDLTYLNELCEGDKDFEKEMLLLFKEQVPADVNQLSRAISEINFNEINALSHKLKSSVSIAGLITVASSFADMESNSKSEKEISSIKRSFENAVSILETAYREIELIIENNY